MCESWQKFILQVRMFFLDHPELMVTESMKRNAIEEIENSISWLRANLERIDGWLKEKGFN